MQKNPTLTLIGHVESSLTDPELAPKQGREGSPDAWLVFRPSFREALDDLKEGDEVIVLTWLDRANRHAAMTRLGLGWEYSARARPIGRIRSVCIGFGSSPSSMD